MIPHSRPTIDDDDVRAVGEVLRSGALAQGARVRAFERAAARALERTDGVAVSSGTAALHLALVALGIGEGDDVLMPAYTCTALLHAAACAGARPVLADVDPATFNIDPASARRSLTARTTAVIVPHMFGAPAELDELAALGVPVIEDCAQALGATWGGRPAGGSGVLTVCSFYATKVITTGEGGMVLGDDAGMLDRIRDVREYDGRAELRRRFNYKMTELQAALGLSQLARLGTFVARRREIAAAYTARLEAVRARLPHDPPGGRHIFYRYVVRAPEAASRAARLREAGVASPRPVFVPLHHLLGGTFPGAEEAAATALSLPIYPSLAPDDVTFISRAAASALELPDPTWVPYSLASSAP